MIAERSTKYGLSYAVRDGDEIVASLSFREVVALVAVVNGHVRWRWRRRQAYGMCDYWLGLDCAVFGVGELTLSTLATKRFRAPDALIAPFAGDPQPVSHGHLQEGEDVAELTPFGAAVAEALLYLPGMQFASTGAEAAA